MSMYTHKIRNLSLESTLRIITVQPECLQKTKRNIILFSLYETNAQKKAQK